MSGRAWVTLATNDSYGLGALVLAHSLRNANSAYPAVVLVTPSVTEAMRNRLSAVFAEVITVNVLDSQDAAHLALLQRPELGITFTKIHCWTLTQYQKCVFLDADTLIIRNCDELFEREELSAAPDVGWPDCFNSGVFVFVPSNETYSRLITFAQERGSFDGGDQGLLNAFFSDWAYGDINKHLPFLYNVTSAAFYSYIPALKHYGQNLKIIHFIGTAKPWLQQFNWDSRTVDAPEHLRQYLQLWWDLFVGQVHSKLDTAMESAVEEAQGPLEPPPVNPPEDVQHSYEPEINPHSEFPWHWPEAPNEETKTQAQHVNMSEIHDPWEHSRGNIPPMQDYSSQPFGLEGVQNEEEIRKHAWEYREACEQNAFCQLIDQQHHQFQPIIHDLRSHDHHSQHSVYSQHENHPKHNSFSQNHDQHSQNTNFEYQNNSHNQYQSQTYQEPESYHQHVDHGWEHNLQDKEHNIIHPEEYHQHNTHETWHNQNQSQHEHSNLEHKNYSNLQVHQYNQFNDHSNKTHNQSFNDSSQLHKQESHNEEHDLHRPESYNANIADHFQQSEIRVAHQHNGYKHSNAYSRTNVEQVYSLYLDHRPPRRHRRHRKLQCIHEVNFNGTANGYLSDSESEEEFVIPRHPYDGFYLRHKPTIDPRGRKICTHEIPPTPIPSPPPEEPFLRESSPILSEEFDTASECEDQYSGVAGNLARVVPGSGSYQREAIDELTRRQGWEAGTIDYMGADSFDNIWAKISQTLQQPPKEPSPPRKEPSPPKEPSKDQATCTPVVESTPQPTPAEPVPQPPAETVAQTAVPDAKAPEGSVDAPASASTPQPTPTESVPEPPTETVAPAAVLDAKAPEPEAPAAPAPAAAEAEVPKQVEEALAIEAPKEQPPQKTEPKVPPTPPATPKSTPEASSPVIESAPEVKSAPPLVEAPQTTEPVSASPVSSAPAAEAPAKPAATPEKAADASVTTTASTDSPPLANTPSKEEPAVPDSPSKSEERRKPEKKVEKLQLRPPSCADTLPTPDSELEDAAALAGAIIASELRTAVTAPTPAADPVSPPTLQEKNLSVDAPEMPSPPVSLAQIGVKPKGKPTTAAQIESSVTEKAEPAASATQASTPATPSSPGPESPAPATPTSPTSPVPPAEAGKKKPAKKPVKKEAAPSGDVPTPVPPPRKKEKKPKEK